MATRIDLLKPTTACTCEPCVLGCIKETPHDGYISLGTALMELLYVDLCRPFLVLGVNGEKY
jgi:hypothetical protein